MNNSSPIFGIITRYRRQIRYVLISIFGTILDSIVYLLLYNAAHIHVSIAEIFAYIVGTSTCFALNKIYTFRDRQSGPLPGQVMKYFLNCFIALMLTDLLLSFFHLVLHWGPFISKLIAMIIVFFYNYTFNNRVVFRERQSHKR